MLTFWESLEYHLINFIHLRQVFKVVLEFAINLFASILVKNNYYYINFLIIFIKAYNLVEINNY